MAEDDGFKTVTKKQKRDTRHYIREREADALEKSMKIAGLSRALLSPESRALQDQGFKFDRVLRGNVPEDQAMDTDTRLSINNKYGDEMVFIKPLNL